MSDSNCEAGSFGKEATQAADYCADQIANPRRETSHAAFMTGVEWCLERLMRECFVHKGLHIAFGGCETDKTYIDSQNKEDWLKLRLHELIHD